MKIRKDDTVIVIAGADKGKKGKVLKTFPKTNKVIVEGITFKQSTENQEDLKIQAESLSLKVQ